MRRRRHQSLASCEDGAGFGESSNTASIFLQQTVDGRMASGSGEGARQPWVGERGGKGSIGRRPALMFLAQAVLSFVGMVVLPSRLAYDVLVQPPRTSSTPKAAAVSLDLGARSSEAAPAALVAGGGGGGGSREKGGRRLLSDSLSGGVWVDEEGMVGGADRTKGRALQTDEDSFTYTSRTQFHLCALQESAIDVESLRGAVVNVFDVDEAQASVVPMCFCEL